jgi:hypothetical protein
MIGRFLTFAIFLGCSAFVLPTNAQDAAKPAAKPSADYRDLVKGLVSPNKPIGITNYPETIAIPPNYDWKVQALIERNRKLLFDHCEEALPFLIEACTDSRYSMVSHWSEDTDYETWSVGRVCSEIIQRHVEVFRHSMRFTPKRWHEYNFVPIPRSMSEKGSKEIREWWHERKGLTLRELQLTGFDWAIAKRTEEFKGNPDIQELGWEIKALASAREELNRRREAISDGMMWQSLLSPPKGYKVLPWTETGK